MGCVLVRERSLVGCLGVVGVVGCLVVVVGWSIWLVLERVLWRIM